MNQTSLGGGVREINLRLTKETSLHSNCLEQELRRRYQTSKQFSLYRMVQSGTGHQHSICISALPHASGPFPMKWATQQFLPHHNHSAPNTGWEPIPGVHQGTMAFATKGSRCRLIHCHTRHRKSKGLPHRKKVAATWETQVTCTSCTHKKTYTENGLCYTTGATSCGICRAPEAARLGNKILLIYTKS